MKKLSTTLASLFLLANIFANTTDLAHLPERIRSISKVAHSQEYYAEQANLWQLETKKNTANADAWLNYFRAARYANMLDRNETPSFDLEAIVTSMPASLSNTFEYQFIRFMVAGWNEDRFKFLLKAHEIAPHRTELYYDLVTYHTINGDQAAAFTFLNKLFEAGEFPSELLAWNYNMLASVGKDAILFTYGDNDTYPLWVLQTIRGIKKDVKALNLSLLLNDDYRARELKSLGLENVYLSGASSTAEVFEKIIRHISAHAKRPVYLANTLPEPLRLALGDSLYLTGLALKYSSSNFDNLALLKNNFENHFLLDYLRVDFTPDSITSIISGMNLQYLPAFVLLHQHYSASGETAKAASLEPLMERVAKEGGRMDILQSYLQPQQPTSAPVASSISVRSLDKGAKKILGAQNLFAFETEVSNAQYEAFLMDLVKNREFEQLEICQAPRTDWKSYLPTEYQQLPDSELFLHAHPDDPDCPVVNISHEAAMRYCEWITKVYNASDDKRKTFKKVKFRLPTEAEWELAARAGRKEVPYPWGGYYIRNAKGCFLANYDVYKEEPCKTCPNVNQGRPDDGGYFPVKGDSYFPNDFGLYNMSGNVAEMIDQPGVTKGGSWYEPPFEGQISNRNTYTKPAPFIGFRVFMEVVEN